MLSLVNNPIFTSGKTNNALSLAGTQYAYRTLNPSDSLQIGTNNFTVAAWVKFSNPASGTNEGIAGTWNSQDKYWYVRKDANQKILFRLSASSNAADIVTATSNTSITDTNFHHIAVTFDRAGSATVSAILVLISLVFI
jgi:Concanavalin A-like lectin/glucanases superfamily